jgi:hypothetical protein
MTCELLLTLLLLSQGCYTCSCTTAMRCRSLTLLGFCLRLLVAVCSGLGCILLGHMWLPCLHPVLELTMHLHTWPTWLLYQLVQVHVIHVGVALQRGGQ